MLFSSTDFIFQFLPVTIVIAAIAWRLGRNAFLVSIAACSSFLYAAHVPIYLALLFASAAANYVLAGYIGDGRRRWLYIVGIAANLALLGYFKYADFFIGTLNDAFGAGIEPLRIVLPLAISFITFEQIAFLVGRPVGPRAAGLGHRIPRLHHAVPEADRWARSSATRRSCRRYGKPPGTLRSAFSPGLCIFSVGLFNKVVIADSLTPIVNPVYAAAGSGLVASSDAVLATLAYSTRIYFDFSGYSTMAIGLAWMFGIRLPINFLSPYRSTSIIDFWRRWHITLSRFLRDYLYFPLGGGRKGEARRYVNLFIVMLLGGLWHGAGWVFVAWGAIHGAALAVNHGWRALAPEALQKVTSHPAIAWPLTMLVVVAAWVFFNAVDFKTAANIFASISNPGQAMVTPNQIAIVIASWAFALLTPNAAKLFRYGFLAGEHGWEHLPPLPVPSFAVTALSALAFAVSIIFVLSGTPNAFIYFQF